MSRLAGTAASGTVLLSHTAYTGMGSDSIRSMRGDVFLYRLIWKRLKGYTGDCCGALFLLIELTTYLIIAILWSNAMKSAAMEGKMLEFMWH